MTQADIEARARAKWLMMKCVREVDLDQNTLGDALADAMLAFREEGRAEARREAFAKAAEVAAPHGLQCECCRDTSIATVAAIAAIAEQGRLG